MGDIIQKLFPLNICEVINGLIIIVMLMFLKHFNYDVQTKQDLL